MSSQKSSPAGGHTGGPLYASILSTGSYVPPKKITNHDLEQMVDTTDEWIRTRVGILERRIAEEEAASSDLGVEASRRAIEAAGIAPSDIDLILCSTVSADMLFPSTACLIARGLGIEHETPAADIAAACSGFSYGLHLANGMIRSGMHRTVLVTAAETLTRFVNWQDRSTCVLFGDAAGAAVVQASAEPGGILFSKIGSEPQYADPDILSVPAGGSRKPATQETVENREHTIRMEGRKLFKIAVSLMPEVILRVLEEAEMTPDDIDLLVPHQMNVRIMGALAKRTGIDLDRVCSVVDRYGNTSSASAALALDEAIAQGRVGPGSTVFLITFGAGWTWGANIVRL